MNDGGLKKPPHSAHAFSETLHQSTHHPAPPVAPVSLPTLYSLFFATTLAGDRMDWNALGAIGQIVAAAGVIISLVYLSRQIAQNTRSLKNANAALVQSNFQQLARQAYLDRDLADLVIRAMADAEDLPPAERLASRAYFFDWLKTAEIAHHQYRCGELDESLWVASLEFYKAYFKTPGFRSYWAERQSAFVPEFRAAMGEWLEAPSALTRTDLYLESAPKASDSSAAFQAESPAKTPDCP
jgi:hypothetical protein